MDLSAFFHLYIGGPLKISLKNYELTTEDAHLCDNCALHLPSFVINFKY